jgi:hypothetical protein
LDSVGVCSFWFFAVIAQAVELGVANARIRAHVPVTAPMRHTSNAEDPGGRPGGGATFGDDSHSDGQSLQD